MDASKRVSADDRAETPRDFLLHFDHPNIALRQAIIKRHGEVVQESQHGILVDGEAIEQIASR